MNCTKMPEMFAVKTVSISTKRRFEMDRCDNCGREYDQTVYYQCPECNDSNFSPFRHLCETCKLEFATCKSNPEFGSGKGNDNVCDCDAYIKKDAHGSVSSV